MKKHSRHTVPLSPAVCSDFLCEATSHRKLKGASVVRTVLWNNPAEVSVLASKEDMARKHEGYHIDTGQGEDGAVRRWENSPPFVTPSCSDMVESDSVDTGIPEKASLDDLWYKMDHEKTGGSRGTCLIINIDNSHGQCEREGADKDCQAIESVFKGILGFAIERRDGLTSKELSNFLDQWARVDHSSSDCFACFVLSRGVRDVMYCTDNNRVTVEAIYSHFTGSASPSLVGKPKLFFIQIIRDQVLEADHKRTVFCADSPCAEETHPTPADLWIFFNTSRGYPAGGSLFFQNICQVLMRDHSSRDFETMMTLVILYAKKEEMPHFETTLTKNLRFATQARALQVIAPPTSKGNTYELKREVLESPMWKDAEDLPVVVITVTGGPRTGKSFLLGYLIRYLEHFESHGSPDYWQCDPDQPLGGFPWSSGRTVLTSGVLVWEKIFKVSTQSRTVAVVLMDTEGVPDTTCTLGDHTTLLSLSMLVSSTVIYNVMTTLDHSISENLQFCASYNNIMKKDLEDSKNGQSSDAFQKLILLVRDWKLSCDIPYGLHKGQETAHEFLAHDEHLDHKTNELRANVRENITDIDCFFMPYPGEKITSGKCDGRDSDLSEHFKRSLDDLFVHIFPPDNPTPKSINGRTLTLRDLRVLLTVYIMMCKEGKLPDVRSAYNVTAFVLNSIIVQGIQKKFESALDQNMPKVLQNERPLQELQQAHSSLKPVYLSKLSNDSIIGKKGEAVQDQLDQMMEASYSTVTYAVRETQKLARCRDQREEQYKTELEKSLEEYKKLIRDICIRAMESQEVPLDAHDRDKLADDLGCDDSYISKMLERTEDFYRKLSSSSPSEA